MPSLGVNIAILNDGKILLTKREDFEVWCLPGGEVDAGESVAQAALREAREETGLEVTLTRLVGIYSRPQSLMGGSHIVLFAAQPKGGALCPQPGEVVDLRYFSAGEVPTALLFGQERRIRDALSGVGGGVAWLQDIPWPFPAGLSRQQIYELRDRSGLTRAEFYLQYHNQYPQGGRLEVGGQSEGDPVDE